MKTMKKTVSVLLSVCILLSLSLPFLSASAAGGDAYFKIDAPDKVTVGSSFDVTISVDGSVGALGFTSGGVSIFYDESKIQLESFKAFPDYQDNKAEFTNAEHGTWVEQFFPYVVLKDDMLPPGEARMTLMTLVYEFPQPEMKFITLHCKALAAGSAQISVEHWEWEANCIPSEGSATVQIQNAMVGKRGDVDLDGDITATDARTALRAAANLEALSEDEYQRADYDGNGVVTATDARTILRVAANLEAPESETGGEQTTKPSVVPTTNAPTTKPNVVPTTSAPTTKPVTPTSAYDRLVQYLKTNGAYKDGDYTLKMSYSHNSTQVVAIISYDTQKSQIVFYSHAFYDSGAASSVGLFFDKNSDSQTVAVLYTTPRGAEYFAGGNIYKQSYSEKNNNIYWSYLDCPSNVTDSLKSIGVSQLSLLFIDASLMLEATGTGITMNSLGFKAY